MINLFCIPVRCVGTVKGVVTASAICILFLTAELSTAASARPLPTGVGGLDSFDPTAFQQVRETGARRVHITVRWPWVAPRQEPASWQPESPADPNYSWTNIDYAVTGAVGAGLIPVLLVNGAPSWAQNCQSPEIAWGGNVCDPDPAALASFTVAATRRYSGHFADLPRVRYWQGLNEPNLSLFFNPQFRRGKPVAPSLYRRLINTFYSAVKSVHPSNLVLAAGLGPIARPHWTIGPMRFARELLCMRGRWNPKPAGGGCKGGVYFDIFDIHPYTTGGPSHQGKRDDVQIGDLKKLQALLAAADRAGRIRGQFQRTPLWITEFSWDSKPPDPGGLHMGVLSRWTAEVVYRVWDAGVRHFSWYGLRDSQRNPQMPFSETLESGLYFRGETVAENRPKPHMYAFRFPLVAYSKPKGFYFWGRTPNSRGGRVLIQVRQGGGWRKAEVVRADRHGIFDGMAKGGYGRKKRGTVRAVYRRERSVPFSLKPVKDFYQPPFGKPVPE